MSRDTQRHADPAHTIALPGSTWQTTAVAPEVDADPEGANGLVRPAQYAAGLAKHTGPLVEPPPGEELS